MTMIADRTPLQAVATTRRLRAADHRLLLATGDAAAGVLAMVVALWLWSIPAGATFSIEFVRDKLPWFAGGALWFLLACLPNSSPATTFNINRTAAGLARGAAMLVLLYLAAYFYAPRGVLPRLVVLYFVWEAVLLTLAWRLVFVAVFSRERFHQRAIVIGSGRAAVLALDTMRQHRGTHPPVDLIVREDATPDPALSGVATIDVGELPDAIARRDVSEIILATRRPPEGQVLQTLLACQEAGIELVRVQTLLEQTYHRVPIELLDPDWLITDLADAVRLRNASWIGKRALDIAGGAAGLAAAAALTPLIALAIRLESRGPILYRQQRLGRGGRAIVMTKFRTMKRDAEQPGEPRWAGKEDPRVTRVGRVLRRTRLDELPQFLSVLRGHMSLVGPRPERAEFVERLEREIPFYRARLMVPPGLTGWAQVNLPYSDSVSTSRQKLEYDLYYIKHRSLLFDLAIIMRTIGTVLRLRGH